jgi:hypothetical protein
MRYQSRVDQKRDSNTEGEQRRTEVNLLHQGALRQDGRAQAEGDVGHVEADLHWRRPLLRVQDRLRQSRDCARDQRRSAIEKAHSE